jgi:hypothetical protein
MADESVATMSKRATWSPLLPHKSNELPVEEKLKTGSVGNVAVFFPLVVGLRRIELAILALRMAGFAFV